jgi:hypothetical protein
MFLLDATGRADPAFGGHEDGFLRLTAESYVDPGISTHVNLVSFALDPSGRIVLVERTIDRDGVCVEPVRIRRLLPSGENDVSFGFGGATELANMDLCGDISIIGVRADASIVIGSGPDFHSIDSDGGIDVTFGADGRLTVAELVGARGLMLPDGGLLIYGSSDESARSSDTVLRKFGRNGQPDLDFGSGTGSVTVDLGAELLGQPLSHENVDHLVLDPDGEHMIAQLSMSHADGSLACGGIARLTLDGVPDAGFGRDGLTCLDFNFALAAVQSNGAPLFSEGSNVTLYRLLPDNKPSPGFLRVTGTRVDESEGTATVAIERFAGYDVAISVDYATYYLPPFHRYPYHIDSATVGSDYTAASGRLDWAGGDDSPRTVSVGIRDDRVDEYWEYFGVQLSDPNGGPLLIASRASVLIVDDDEDGSISPPTSSGGGGSVSWVALLGLLSLLFVRRQRVWPAAAG